MSHTDRVGDGFLRKLDAYLPRSISPWLVVAVLGVAFGVRSVLKEYIGPMATPILFIVMAAVYYRQHQVQKQKEAEDQDKLDELQREQIKEHLTRRREMQQLSDKHGPDRAAAALAASRGPALRSGDSFSGDIPKRSFAGDSQWSGPPCIDQEAQARVRRRQLRYEVGPDGVRRPVGGGATGAGATAGGRSTTTTDGGNGGDDDATVSQHPTSTTKPNKFRHDWKVTTSTAAEQYAGAAETKGAGPADDEDAPAGTFTTEADAKDPRAALRPHKQPNKRVGAPLVPANVTVTEGGRRLYTGRTAEQLARRQKRLEAMRAQKARLRSKKRLTGVPARLDDAGAVGDRPLHDLVASGAVGADRRGIRGTGSGVSVGAMEARRAAASDGAPASGVHDVRVMSAAAGAGGAAVSVVGSAGSGAGTGAGGAVGNGVQGTHGAGGGAVVPQQPPWSSVGEFLTAVKLPQYEREFAAEDMTDVDLLVGMARRDRAELREALKEVGVTKLGHFERIAQALAPYAK